MCCHQPVICEIAVSVRPLINPSSPIPSPQLLAPSVVERMVSPDENPALRPRDCRPWTTLCTESPVMTPRAPILGLCAIAIAVGFNLPYAHLVAIYDYPDILREPASVALTRFAAGGTALILTWHAFAWAALLLVPLSIGLGMTPQNRATSERLAVAAALTGALSGVAQAIGLWRWVFVIPGLARTHAAGDAAARAAAEGAFDILNSYGGIAIGEHLGQWLLVFFGISLSALQWRQRRRIVSGVGLATALAIAIGTTEGLAVALGRNGDMFSLFTIAGFLGLTLWLILTGLGHLGLGQPRQTDT